VIRITKTATCINRFAAAALIGGLLSGGNSQTAQARTPEELQQIATEVVGDLAKTCPHIPGKLNDADAFKACAAKLAQIKSLPFAPAILWGGDQAQLRVRDRNLTRFRPDVFRDTYMPMLAFTGKFTLARDDRENMDIIRAEAYFRNDLPAGDYPYPFWHSDAKWSAYETMNTMSFYLDNSGRIVVVTRGNTGSEQARGTYGHVARPAFVKDRWVWQDASGGTQPQVMLFASRYRSNNPSLPRLDVAYRAFADNMREASCVSCHAPNNSQGAKKLILLQTPLHAAGEIDWVIQSVDSKKMPEDEKGLQAEIDPKLREAILRTARAFRDELRAADAWEARQRRTDVQGGSALAGRDPGQSGQSR